MSVKAFLVSAALLFGLSNAASAASVTLDFDDIPTTGPCCGAVPNPYQGFSFTNYLTITSSFGFDAYALGVTSGTQALFGFGTALISSPTPFSFISAELGSPHLDGQQYDVIGSLGGSTIFSQIVTLFTTGPTDVTFNWSGIDTISIAAIDGAFTGDPFGCAAASNNCNQFTLDDLTVSSTPLPGALPLFASGLGVMGFLAKRRKRKTAAQAAA
jgi:hypothetical protein